MRNSHPFRKQAPTFPVIFGVFFRTHGRKYAHSLEEYEVPVLRLMELIHIQDMRVLRWVFVRLNCDGNESPHIRAGDLQISHAHCEDQNNGD